jgi:hypothetical protein
MDTHLNVLPVARLAAILFLFGACVLVAGCASEEPLNFDEHAPVAGEATPPPTSGARSGWAW